MKTIDELVQSRVRSLRVAIGQRVRDARKKADKSQSDLAKETKLSLTTINRLEKGKQLPHRSNLNEIAKVLGVDLLEGLDADPAILESASEAMSRAELIARIVDGLPALNEDELGSILAIIDEAAAAPRVRTGR